MASLILAILLLLLNLLDVIKLLYWLLLPGGAPGGAGPGLHSAGGGGRPAGLHGLGLAEAAPWPTTHSSCVSLFMRCSDRHYKPSPDPGLLLCLLSVLEVAEACLEVGSSPIPSSMSMSPSSMLLVSLSPSVDCVCPADPSEDSRHNNSSNINQKTLTVNCPGQALIVLFIYIYSNFIIQTCQSHNNIYSQSTNNSFKS